jgi:large subunit ribosomal protein L17
MRHGKKINHLSRKTAHRGAMLANMACSLIEHKRINTTLAKAKALRKYVEPLITKSKDDTTHNRRVVFSYLKSKEASSVLFRDVAPKINDRPGGYTRIIKLNNRLGDNAEMAMIELVDFNELLVKGDIKKKKTRRRGGKKSTDNTNSENVAKENVKDSSLDSDVIEDAVVVEENTTKEATTEPVNKKEEIVAEEDTTSLDKKEDETSDKSDTSKEDKKD